jgi:GNAT superfamily N-acetyltransferase
VLEEQPLDPKRHHRDEFTCGVPALDDYLRRFATQHRRKGFSTVHVLVNRDEPSRILGYYSLSAAQLDGAALAPADRAGLPRYPVPCFRMGRLACRADRRGEGLGKLLVGLAVRRCLDARELVAAYALIVDAKDEAAKRFYEHHGFAACVDAPLTLYFPFGR